MPAKEFFKEASLSRRAKLALVVALIGFLVLIPDFLPLQFNSANSITNFTQSDVPNNSSGGVQTIEQLAQYSTQLEIGAFYYPWYGWNPSSGGGWIGGNGSGHWNNGALGVAKDEPAIGYYASLNNGTLGYQINQMREVGINLIIVSWQGWGVTDFANTSYISAEHIAIDNATLNIFKYLSASGIQNFKIALMVDVFNHTASGGNADLNSSDYAQIYSYVWEKFYSLFPNLVFNWQGKPLLCWFNPLNPPANSTFTTRVLGQSSIASWYFWKAITAPQSYSGIPQISMYRGSPVISSDGVVSILPRYDDYYIYLLGGRSTFMRFDENYSQSLYSQEWNFVLNHKASINLVLIYSWNEYHERSEIEPHFDYTSAQNQCYLAELTGYYAQQLLTSGISNSSSKNINSTTASSLSSYCPVLYTGASSTSSSSVAPNPLAFLTSGIAFFVSVVLILVIVAAVAFIIPHWLRKK